MIHCVPLSIPTSLMNFYLLAIVSKELMQYCADQLFSIIIRYVS